ncbi:hypothetical protein [Actinophytocola sp.]|uniref:hypothetical protein n=1 Tax=Actinophytocola sp. TaxID=1872138 RepID=UPI003D6A46A6
MPDPIEANYVPDGDDWVVTVSGRGQRLTGKAPGLIAARDRADQLVEKLAPEEKFRTVVHMLDGDAVRFTNAYLTARLARPAEPAAAEEKPAPKPSPKPKPKPKSTAKSTAKPAPKPAPDQQAAEPPAPREHSSVPSKAAANRGRGAATS